MSEAPDPIFDEYDAFLQAASGLNRRIAESAPRGTQEKPNAIVEIDGTGRRVFPKDVMAERHLIAVNVGEAVSEFNRTIPVEDVNAANLESLLKDVPVSSAILAHPQVSLKPDRIRDALFDLLSEMEEGGRVYCISAVHWNGQYAAVQEAIQTAQSACGPIIQVAREMILPVLSMRFAEKMRTTPGPQEISMIINAVRAGTKEAVISILPLDLPLQKPFCPGKARYVGTKLGATCLAEEMITVTKLTKAQLRLRKQVESKRQERKRR